MAVDFSLILLALRQKLQAFQDMAIISEKQLEFLNSYDVVEDSPEQLEQYIETRDKLILKVDGIQEKINAYRIDLGLIGLNDGEIRQKIGSEQHQALIQCSEEIVRVITSIQANDRQCQKLMQISLDETGMKINQTREHKKAYDAYVPNNSYSEAWFFDKKK